jgi:hypothetical protein
MKTSSFDLNDSDRRIWEEDLADFVPARIFDAHCHMFAQSHMRPGAEPSTRNDEDFTTHVKWAQLLFPGRQLSCLVLGMPLRGIDLNRHNTFVAEQVARGPGWRANGLVTPACTTAQIERDINSGGFIGLKPYRIYSVTGDSHNCRIHEFLTHEQMELADQLGLWVTMHLARSHACADEHNLKDLQEYTNKRYPRIKWILAHCARSFTYWPIRQAVDRLRDMPNIWYDLSAVTNVHPHLTLFQKEDLNRIFYGSDGVNATGFHGKYAVFGRYWFQVDPGEEGYGYAHTEARPIMAIYEQVLAMKQAADIAGLSRDDVERIFWRNAVEALEIE